MTSPDQRCHLCGSLNLAKVLDDIQPLPHPEQISYWHCGDCSLGSYFAETESFGAMYLEATEGKTRDDKLSYFRQQLGETGHVIESIRTLIPNILDGQNRTVVDVGAGMGGGVSFYKDLGWKGIGIEPGIHQAAFARDEFSLDVRDSFYDKDSFEKNSVDMFHSYHVLEHTYRPFDVFAAMFTHLKPGGYIYIETPNILATSQEQLGGGHVSMFSPRTLSGAIAAAGFEIKHVIDRRGFNTFGVGVIAQKPTGIKTAAQPDENGYLPKSHICWRPHTRIQTHVAIWFAFYGGTIDRPFYKRLAVAIIKSVFRSESTQNFFRRLLGKPQTTSINQ